MDEICHKQQMKKFWNIYIYFYLIVTLSLVVSGQYVPLIVVLLRSAKVTPPLSPPPPGPDRRRRWRQPPEDKLNN